MWCDLFIGLCNILWVLIHCMLEDGYGFAPYLPLVVCQHRSFFVQQSVVVQIEEKLCMAAALIVCILGVV